MNFRIRERNGAFGLAARVGKWGAERTEQKAEWSGGFGNSSRERQSGERKSCEFRGVVFQGESKARSLARRGGPMGPYKGQAGARTLVSQTERPGVERSTFCVGPDAQSKRSETEHP